MMLAARPGEAMMLAARAEEAAARGLMAGEAMMLAARAEETAARGLRRVEIGPSTPKCQCCCWGFPP